MIFLGNKYSKVYQNHHEVSQDINMLYLTRTLVRTTKMNLFSFLKHPVAPLQVTEVTNTNVVRQAGTGMFNLNGIAKLCYL